MAKRVVEFNVEKIKALNRKNLFSLFKEIGLHPFVGCKVFVPDYQNARIDCPTFSAGIRIYRNRTTDPACWSVSSEMAGIIRNRMKTMNPHMRAYILNLSKKLSEVR